MYVRRLEIENLKCFVKTSVDLNYPGKTYRRGVEQPRLDNVNLFVGENGAGKSAVCQALCLAALHPLLATSAAGFRTEGLVRLENRDAVLPVRDDKTATIDAHLVLSSRDGGEGEATARAILKRINSTEFLEMGGQPPKWAIPLFEENSPAFFLAAYSANRRTERPEAYNERLRNLRYQRVATLFESHVGMRPLEANGLRPVVERLDEIKDLINNNLFPKHNNTIEKGELVLWNYNVGTSLDAPSFNIDGVQLPLSALSDGYRNYFGWILDFIYHLARVFAKDTPLREAEGVVIVDEIDLLLHVGWQRYVVETVATAFPRIQFLFTTHSPIVAGTMESQNIFLADRVAPGISEIRACEEDVEGLSMEAILARLFGLKSSRAPRLEMQLAELAQKAMKGDDDASMEYLRRLAEGPVK